jgi:acyl-CoA thioester hydrolase
MGAALMSTAILVHRARIAVRWGDLDALGHVNAARYFTYFEQARAEWMRAHGLAITTDQGPVLARTSCAFRRPLFYPDEILVEILAEPPRRSSLLTRYRILDGKGILCAEGDGTVVWFDFESNRPVRFPDDLIDRLMQPYDG